MVECPQLMLNCCGRVGKVALALGPDQGKAVLF
jgi:hypothetical protein